MRGWVTPTGCVVVGQGQPIPSIWLQPGPGQAQWPTLNPTTITSPNKKCHCGGGQECKGGERSEFQD